MKTIKVIGTSIEITVNTAEEMHSMFSRLNSWEELEVDGDLYLQDPNMYYTVNYFKAKYF